MPLKEVFALTFPKRKEHATSHRAAGAAPGVVRSRTSSEGKA